MGEVVKRPQDSYLNPKQGITRQLLNRKSIIEAIKYLRLQITKSIKVQYFKQSSINIFKCIQGL